jgi:hypothetical protein
MPWGLNRIMILVCGLLTGCATIDSVSLSPGQQGHDSSKRFSLARLFSRYDADGLPSFSSDHELQAYLLLRATRGTYVAIRDESHRSFIGILRRANKKDFELLNCVTMEVAQGPDGQKYAKRIHVPFKSFQTSSLTSFSDISERLPDSFPAEQVYNVRDFTPDTIVFASGRRQRWVEPVEANASDRDASPAETTRDHIAGTTIGSQVSVVNEFDQRFNGILMSSGLEGMELMSCISREIVPGPDGQDQIQTSHIPFQFFQTRSIKAFAVVAAPAPDFDVSEIGLDHHEYFISEFESMSGSHHHWGVPHKCDCTEERGE